MHLYGFCHFRLASFFLLKYSPSTATVSAWVAMIVILAPMIDDFCRLRIKLLQFRYHSVCWRRLLPFLALIPRMNLHRLKWPRWCCWPWCFPMLMVWRLWCLLCRRGQCGVFLCICCSSGWRCNPWVHASLQKKLRIFFNRASWNSSLIWQPNSGLFIQRGSLIYVIFVSFEQPTEDAFIEEETQSFRKKNIQFTHNFNNGSKFKVSTSLIIIYGKF